MTAVEKPVVPVPDERKPFKDELYEFVGWRIRDLRLSQRWTQTDLAALLERHPGTVSGWEDGKKSISLVDLCAVADMFDVSPRWFLPAEGGDV